MRRISVLLGSAAAIVLTAGIVPAVAQAATAASPVLWVSPETPVAGNGTSCTAPGSNTIQGAITAAPAGATIEVCAGTYTEQLQITQSVTIDGQTNAVLQLPSSPVNSTAACDNVQGAGPDQDGIVICGKSTSVTISNLVVNAAWATSVCNDNLYGIVIGGGATLSFDNSSIIAAGAFPLNGCQGGIGIEAGMAFTKPVEVGHLKMHDSWISGYQKNGIVVDGWKSTAAIGNSVVTGAGPQSAIAQNGIQVSDAAKAVITGTTVSGNECEDNAASCGANGLANVQSAGILLFGAARGTSITNSTMSYNDMGAYYSADPQGAAVKKPQVTFSKDDFVDNRYEGVVLDQGSASLTGSNFSRTNVGIEVIQYGGTNGQTFGSFSAATGDTFSVIHNATVDVLSDRLQSDKAGSFTITHSQIYLTKIRDNSKSLPIIHKDDTK